MEHIKIKKARKSLIYTLLEVFGKPAGGESGIRTLDTLLGYTHFPGVLLRPLGQLSSLSKNAANTAISQRERKDRTIKHTCKNLLPIKITGTLKNRKRAENELFQSFFC